MNHSIYSADRATHLKIVVVSLLCATLVAAIGTFAHISDVDLGTTQLVKAGQPTAVTGRLPDIRQPQFVSSTSEREARVMPPHVTERSNSSRYDGVEIMTIGLGVLLIVAIACVFGI